MKITYNEISTVSRGWSIELTEHERKVLLGLGTDTDEGQDYVTKIIEERGHEALAGHVYEQLEHRNDETVVCD